MRKRKEFYEEAKQRGELLVIYDIPLLFENRAAYDVDYIIVATAAEEIQRARCLNRMGMNEEKLNSILAKQVPDAIKKANEIARRKLIHIPLREGRTIHHDVKAKDGSGRIVLRAASKGTGIIAGGPVRAVCEVLGVKDIVAKSMGTSNAHNVIRATIKALMKQNSPKQISSIRNIKISEVIEKRG